MRKGLDLLGMALYPNEALKAFVQGYAIGAFWSEFGSVTKLSHDLYVKGCRIFRFQAIWDGSHGYDIKKNLPTLKAACLEIQAFKKAHPDARILISPFCEHNHTAKEMAPVFKSMTQWAPDCEQVNCIWKGQFIPNMLNEVHGEAPKLPDGRFIVSADGTDLTTINIPKWNARHINAEIKFGWIKGFNLLGAKPELPPKQRKKKPSVSDIQNVEHWI